MFDPNCLEGSESVGNLDPDPIIDLKEFFSYMDFTNLNLKISLAFLFFVKADPFVSSDHV